MNEALKTRWLWRFAIDDDALSKKLLYLNMELIGLVGGV